MLNGYSMYLEFAWNFVISEYVETLIALFMDTVKMQRNIINFEN